MAKKIGTQTIRFEKKLSVAAGAAIVGPLEGEGPLSTCFDSILTDDCCGEDSFEKGESMLMQKVYDALLAKARLSSTDIDLFIGGDLLNQIIATSYAVAKYDRPYWGIYNACATFGEALQIGSAALEAGMAKHIIASASSHFSSAERQFRTPLELGSQNAVTAQRTITGGGASLLGVNMGAPYITAITTGIIVDFECNDACDMSTAMAPAAAQTLLTHFRDTKTTFMDYDMVITGDLASIGVDIVSEMMRMEGYETKDHFTDCGLLIYDREKQPITDSGGSGAGCSAAVFNSYILNKLKTKEWNRVLLVPTGALLSSITSYQKRTIPAIAHAVVIENNFQGV